MIKKVLILGGGISKEKAISIQTAKAVLTVLKKKNYKVIICEPDENLTKIIKKFKPDVVFNALHGRFGEDGYIQTILESEKIKYTHSGVLASSIAMDKEISKKIFLKNNILTPKYVKYNFSNNLLSKKDLISSIEKKLNFPVVVKPINEGSSVHVYICNKKNLINNIKKLSHYKEILIEEFIPGREIQVAILGKKKIRCNRVAAKEKIL